MGVRERAARWRTGLAAARAAWQAQAAAEGRLLDAALNVVPGAPGRLPNPGDGPPAGLALDPDQPHPHFSVMCHRCASGGDFAAPQRAWRWAVEHARRPGHDRFVAGTTCYLAVKQIQPAGTEEVPAQ
ncbi:DUF7848 domain-containing protein [Wenjunlia vitaminophila]|uniref:DUF7848 domain-containing protein n=1 Tax=Wenjunlia vitaminophila TaxID=76728 RepID=UPI00036EC1A5|nr:hypothetical protein [Wenjunlia vitaminophila]